MDISIGTDPFKGTLDTDLQERWFNGITDDPVAISTTHEPRSVAKIDATVDSTRREQREAEDIADIIDQVDIDEGDCLPDDAPDGTFVIAKDIFGRERKVLAGSNTAKRIQERERRLEEHSTNEKRKVATYEDI